MYAPLADLLRRNGFTVRGEVNHCDLAACRDDELVVIEMKNQFNLRLVLQAVQRQLLTDSVYVVIPHPGQAFRSRAWKIRQHLLHRLELGLILIRWPRGKPAVQVVFHPLPFERKKQKSKRRAVLHEMTARSGDDQPGGVAGTPLLTAYREQAIYVACCLEAFGPLPTRRLRQLGTGSKTQSILYDNYYGWFERIERGVYALKPAASLALQAYSDLVRRCREQIKQHNQSEERNENRE